MIFIQKMKYDHDTIFIEFGHANEYSQSDSRSTVFIENRPRIS